MPRDSDFGRDLATQLTALYSGRIHEVKFTYDAFVELDRLEESRPYCTVSPNLYQHVREGRAIWREQIQIVLSLVSAVGSTDDERWIDQWLESWDTIVRQTREIKVLGEHKALSVDLEERYNTDMFHSNRRLFTQAVLTYGNTEVI